MENNRTIVKFPSKMQVESPEIKSISKSTKLIADIFHKDFTAIVKPLMNLEKLPDLFTSLKDLITRQFTNLFTNQVEATILTRQANVKVLNNKISYIEQHVKKKEEHVESTTNNISKRYKEIASDMASEHEKFLKKLDSHAFGITDTIYPTQVQEKFSNNVQPNIDYLTNHANESAFVRTISINEDFIEAKNKIESFLEEREIFNMSLIDNSTDTVAKDGLYHLPVWFVEVENKETGETELKYVLSEGVESEVHVETLDLIEQLIDTESEKIIDKQETDQKFLDELTQWMKKNVVVDSEIERFKKDCQTIKVEV